MNIIILKQALEDELQKIADINLMGLAPASVLGAKMAPPLETPGTAKAMEALQRAAQINLTKTAGKFKQFNKKYLGPGLAGAAKGALLASLVPPLGSGDKIFRNAYRARLIGAALGSALNIMAKESMLSPAMSLQSTQRIGTTEKKIKAGPKLSTQIRGSLVGQKGTLPGV